MDPILILSEILTHAVIWSCVIIFILLFRKLSRSYRLLAISSFIQALLIVLNTYLLLLSVNNWFTRHIGAHLEFALLGACFYFLFTDKRFKNALLILGGFYTFFSVLDTIYLEPLTVAPGNIILVGSVISILCALGLFYQIFREGKVLYIERHPHFWLSSSVLVYFGCTIFISMFHNYIAFDLPLWMYDFFFFADLFIFFVSKVFLLYGAYLLAFKYKEDDSLIPHNVIKTA